MTTPESRSPASIAELIEYHKHDCSRLMHGSCYTRRCLVRAGYKDGESKLPIPPDMATCEALETVNILLRSSESGITISPGTLDVLVCVAQGQRSNRALSSTALYHLEVAEKLLAGPQSTEARINGRIDMEDRAAGRDNPGQRGT